MVNLSNLERLSVALDTCGVKKYGRNIVVATETGYSPGMVAKVLSGHAALTDRFIKAICSAFYIREEWIYYGEEPIEEKAGRYQRLKSLKAGRTELAKIQQDLQHDIEWIEASMLKYRDIVLEFSKIQRDERADVVKLLSKIKDSI